MKTEELKAGRQLDALVAVKVMGFEMSPEDLVKLELPDQALLAGGCPAYSTDISAAWEIVEKLDQRVTVIKTRVLNDERYRVELRGPAHRFEFCEVAPAAPLAICLVALRVVGYTFQ